jgi:hypothetical protein
MCMGGRYMGWPQAIGIGRDCGIGTQPFGHFGFCLDPLEPILVGCLAFV